MQAGIQNLDIYCSRQTKISVNVLVLKFLGDIGVGREEMGGRRWEGEREGEWSVPRGLTVIRITGSLSVYGETGSGSRHLHLWGSERAVDLVFSSPLLTSTGHPWQRFSPF